VHLNSPLSQLSVQGSSSVHSKQTTVSHSQTFLPKVTLEALLWNSLWNKVKLLLCLSKHHTTKTHGGMEVWIHGFLTSRMVIFTLRLLYPLGKSHIGYLMYRRRLCGPQSRSGRGGEDKNATILLKRLQLLGFLKKFPLLWKPKVNYRGCSSPTLDHILSHMNSIHTVTHILQTHFNIILPSTSTCSNRSSPFRFPN
jgi:hypothetical protein